VYGRMAHPSALRPKNVHTEHLLSDTPPGGGLDWQLDWGSATGLGLDPPPLGERGGGGLNLSNSFYTQKMTLMIGTIIPI